MFRTIILKTHHTLGIALAKERINERFETTMKAWLGRLGVPANVRWDENRASITVKALTQTVAVTIDVGEREITITIKLPLILAPLAGVISTFVEENIDALSPGVPASGKPSVPPTGPDRARPDP